MSWETAAMRDGIMSGVRAQVARDQRAWEESYNYLASEHNDLVDENRKWARAYNEKKSEKEEAELELKTSKQHIDVLKQNLTSANVIVKKQSDVIANDVKIITDLKAALAKTQDAAYKESVKNIANKAVIEGFKLTVKAIDPENYILKDAKKMKVPGTEREATGYDLVYITSVAKQLISKGIDITEIRDYL